MTLGLSPYRSVRCSAAAASGTAVDFERLLGMLEIAEALVRIGQSTKGGHWR